MGFNSGFKGLNQSRLLTPSNTISRWFGDVVIYLSEDGVVSAETWWATHKRQVINLWNSCILLVDLFETYGDARTCERQIQLYVFIWLENLYIYIYIYIYIIVLLCFAIRFPNCEPVHSIYSSNRTIRKRLVYKHVTLLLHVSAYFGHLQSGG
jgi:hypothetical protein